MLVFVYGSLKKGHHNHGLLEDARPLGRDRIEGWVMYSLGAFPAIAEGEGSVTGEVYEIDEHHLPALDYLEGYPRFYDRKQVETVEGRVCWVYFHHTPPNNQRVEPGVW